MQAVGSSVERKEAADKVTGGVKYNGDNYAPELLHARLVVSPHAHAIIRGIDIQAASQASGVQAVLTGEFYPHLYGPMVEDRPPLALDKVRYCGEPVALVVANSEFEAAQAVNLVQVQYELLPHVDSPRAAVAPDAPLVHADLGTYALFVPEVYPEPGTNVAHRVKIRKGDLASGQRQSEVVIHAQVKQPHASHAAMETRNAMAQIKSSGQVIIHTATQGPFFIKKMLAKFFKLDESRITVITPLVGGAFGGKTMAQLEFLALMASQAVQGRPVRLVNTREEDLISSPGHISLEADITLGATSDGKIVAAEMTYLVGCGAYTDSAPNMAKAIAAACTGPYNIPNVCCDSVAVYTNTPYTTAFRGFGHDSLTFAIERALDKLAAALAMDPLELRIRNAIRPGDDSPTGESLTLSSLGDLPACLEKLRETTNWDEGCRFEVGPNLIRSKGMACFWKTSSSPVNAISGALLTMNKDGSINLNCGVVEIGQGTKTALAQILAEKLQMDVSQISVIMDVNTDVSPEHWKTVASKGVYMAGKAVLRAAEDLIRQLCSIGAIALRCEPDDLRVANSRVFLHDNPELYIEFKDIAHGYSFANGNALGGQIMGHGNFIMRHLTHLDPTTGRGRSGPGWTVGCQAVEVEYNTLDHTFRILRAATVIDLGKAINPRNARAVLTSGMSMGLGLASREELVFNAAGQSLNAQLRTYKLLRYGEQPEYLVEFIETPQGNAPCGQRGIGEHGVLGMPPALANALSLAAGVELDQLPITPEVIWAAKTGGKL